MSTATLSPAVAPSELAHGRPSELAHRRVALMGLDFAAVSERETVEYILSGLADGRGGWVATVNLDILRQWHHAPEVKELISQADIVVADGMPLIWAGGIQGSPLPERVAGSTLVRTLSAAAGDAAASVFLLGGNPGTAEAAAGALTEERPDLRVAGTLCPPFEFETDPEWIRRIEVSLREAQPDVVFVGLGCPKQERLIVALREHLPRAWFIPCGISFSYLAGEVHRAPVILQRMGFEWLHRLVQEPKRLVRRYLVHGTPFLLKLLWSAVLGRVRGARATA
jgi:N-acetylglucosaminyldiphosphoundecaprenol N-acetyl-beta-D-mannosaminyltransferase